MPCINYYILHTTRIINSLFFTLNVVCIVWWLHCPIIYIYRENFGLTFSDIINLLCVCAVVRFFWLTLLLLGGNIFSVLNKIRRTRTLHTRDGFVLCVRSYTRALNMRVIECNKKVFWLMNVKRSFMRATHIYI